MTSKLTRTILAVSAASLALFGAVACNSNESASPSSSSSAAPTSSAKADAGADLVGEGCKGYAEQVPNGPGSVAGMSADPVAVAASNNPLLKTLVAAVSGKLNPKVDLVSTLNGSEFTVFAPVDSAFAKLDPAVIEKLKTDDALLSKILTYHVVAGQIAPNKIAGDHVTLEKGSVKVTGSGNDLKVNDSKVICGGVHTANATVYLIDTVLSPPAA
ncbi:fasciclin domain-containing protein [Pseudonocardiaceae bacterium YIM PH 21723]|nr:fasciclin domain-containing protein [Pseudonocardiaceae bacterium YIM PH 21723]